ncbi:MAG: hypothetical protein WAN35_01660 [Terracidiphilus sp.]
MSRIEGSIGDDPSTGCLPGHITRHHCSDRMQRLDGIASVPGSLIVFSKGLTTRCNLRKFRR